MHKKMLENAASTTFLKQIIFLLVAVIAESLILVALQAFTYRVPLKMCTYFSYQE